MNNFTFGNARHQYYETISGGTAGPVRTTRPVARRGFRRHLGGAGTHDQLAPPTDPEVLEFRFPVRLESYEIRHGSGGGGRYPGGDGGVRRMRFLEDMTAAILSNNRLHAPFGLSGGQPGAMGRNYVERADGTVQPLVQRTAPSCVRAMCSWWKRREAAATARCRRWAARRSREASGFRERRFSFRIVHHVQRDLRARLAVVHAQRDFAVADLKHGGGQRVLAIGVMPVRAQDRQCASVSCSAAATRRRRSRATSCRRCLRCGAGARATNR